jgi:hypothetical protein
VLLSAFVSLWRRFFFFFSSLCFLAPLCLCGEDFSSSFLPCASYRLCGDISCGDDFFCHEGTKTERNTKKGKGNNSIFFISCSFSFLLCAS